MRLKMALGMALLLLVVIFTLQNTEVIAIRFLFWDLSLSRALMLFLVLAVGILIGFLAGASRAHPGDGRVDMLHNDEAKKNF